MPSDSPEPRKPASRRSWLRFGLRTLLVLITVACVWLAIVFNQCRRQRRAVEAIERVGGIVGFDYQFDAGKADVPSPGPVWLLPIVGQDLFREPVHVEIRGEGIDDVFLAEHLAGIRSTEFLLVESDNFTDASLARIAKLPNVDMLHVISSGITDAGLRDIGKMKQLTALGLESPQVTDAGVAQLSELTRLRALTLDYAKISPQSIRRLKALDEVIYVKSIRNPVNETPLAALRQPEDFNFAGLPLADVLEFLAADGEPQFDVSRLSEESRSRPISINAIARPLGESLAAILEQADLDYYLDRGTIRITTPETAAPHRAGERACRETFPKAERIIVDW